MTSRNLFFRRMKQDLDQRIWLPVIYFIVMFLLMELILVSRIDAWKDRIDYVHRMYGYLMDSYWGLNVPVTVFTVAMAVVCALSCFSYMHSSKRLDVYHSIPVKREVLFGQQYLYGVLYFAVPFFIHILIGLGLCALNGVLGGTILWQAVCFFFSQILFFLVCYGATIAAVCLTGNMVISVLGTAVLSVYSLILLVLKVGLMDKYFVTFYSSGEFWNDAGAFSPIHLVCKVMFLMGEADSDYITYQIGAGSYLELILMAAIYSLAAMYLYKMRPSEVAGAAIAFPVTEPIIKTIVVFPVSILFGYLISNIVSSGNENRWFVLGSVFGFLFCCSLMEIIFRKDVKAVFKHPFQIVFNGLFVICVLAVLHYDLLGYDTYIPDREKVESYAIYLGDMPSVYGGYSITQYQLENMTIDSNEGARMLLEHAAEFTRPARKGKYDDVIAQDQKAGNAGASYQYTHMLVKYNLNNGREVYRSLIANIADEEVMRWLGDTFMDPAYKEAVYPVLAKNASVDYNGLLLEYNYGSEAIKLTEEQKNTFLKVYCEELSKLTLSELVTELPVAELSFAKSKTEDGDNIALRETIAVGYDEATSVLGYYGSDSGYYIYPSFTGSIKLLKELGAKVLSELPVEAVTLVTVDDYTREVWDKDGLNTKEVILEYSGEAGQQKKISQILSAIVSENMIHPFKAEERVEEYIYVHVEYSHQGESEFGTYKFKKGCVPKFLTEEIEDKLRNTGAAQ